jgi:hypothetical protein
VEDKLLRGDYISGADTLHPQLIGFTGGAGVTLAGRPAYTGITQVPRTYKIHPAIGVGQLGSSQTGWFIGPETPGQLPNLSDPAVSQPSNGKYKDGPGSIKRQAARFRVYEYDDAGGTPTAVREITDQEAEIAWSVRLGNRKAFGPMFAHKGDRNTGIPEGRLVTDSGSQLIKGANAGPVRLAGTFQGTNAVPAVVPLGDLRTDAGGRLLVLGGFGHSFSPAGTPLSGSTFNNDDWCDDTSDGSVSATLTMRDTRQVIRDVTPAWVIVGPPDFAPPISNVITLYDIVYDAAMRDFSGFHYDPSLASGAPSFARHVFPILATTAGPVLGGGSELDVRWAEGSPPWYRRRLPRSRPLPPPEGQQQGSGIRRVESASASVGQAACARRLQRKHASPSAGTRYQPGSAFGDVSVSDHAAMGCRGV